MTHYGLILVFTGSIICPPSDTNQIILILGFCLPGITSFYILCLKLCNDGSEDTSDSQSIYARQVETDRQN